MILPFLIKSPRRIKLQLAYLHRDLCILAGFEVTLHEKIERHTFGRQGGQSLRTRKQNDQRPIRITRRHRLHRMSLYVSLMSFSRQSFSPRRLVISFIGIILASTDRRPADHLERDGCNELGWPRNRRCASCRQGHCHNPILSVYL